jgi:hypothetical protein
MSDENNSYDMPEDTVKQCIEKISSLAWDIRSDWNDPRNECREIVRLCEKLTAMLKAREGRE